MFSQEQLLLHICLFVLLKSVFSGRCRLKSTQTDGETLCGAPQAKDARSGQVYSAAEGQNSGLSGFGVTQHGQLRPHLPVNAFQGLPVR